MSLSARTVADLRPVRGLKRRLVHEAGVGAVLLMEVVWIVPWLRGLTPRLGALSMPAATGLLLGLSVLAMAMVRVARRLELRPGVRALVLLLVLILSALLAVRLTVLPADGPGPIGTLFLAVSSFAGIHELLPDELLVILAVLYAWRRGVVAAVRDPLDPARAAHGFRLGILAFTVHALVYREANTQLFSEALPVFGVAGVAGVGLARADKLSATRAGGGTPFTVQWLAAILVTGGITVLAGMAVGAFLQSSVGLRVAAWVGRIAFRAVEGLLLAAGPIVVALASAVEAALRFLIDVLGLEPRPGGLLDVLPGPDLLEISPEPETPAWLVHYGPALRMLGTSLVVVLLAILAVRGVRRKPQARFEPPDDLVERLRGERKRRAGLRDVLGMAWRRRRGWVGRRRQAAQAVRRMYASLLRLAEARGVPRPAARTPLEFLPSLEGLFPDHQREVGALTRAYLRVRYGEVPEEEEEIVYLEACLSALEAAPRAPSAPAG